MDTPYRRLLGQAAATGVLDGADFTDPRWSIRLHHALTHIKREQNLRALMFMHERTRWRIESMIGLRMVDNLSMVMKQEEQLYEQICDLMLGKSVKQTPAQMAKKFKSMWSKVFGDMDSPEVQARVDAAAKALMKRKR